MASWTLRARASRCCKRASPRRVVPSRNAASSASHSPPSSLTLSKRTDATSPYTPPWIHVAAFRGWCERAITSSWPPVLAPIRCMLPSDFAAVIARSWPSRNTDTCSPADGFCTLCAARGQGGRARASALESGTHRHAMGVRPCTTAAPCGGASTPSRATCTAATCHKRKGSIDSIVAANRGAFRNVPADTPPAGRLGSPSGRDMGIFLACAAHLDRGPWREKTPDCRRIINIISSSFRICQPKTGSNLSHHINYIIAVIGCGESRPC